MILLEILFILDPQSLRDSFLFSVKNEPAWEPVITRSVQRCAYDLIGSSDEYQCEVVPMEFYSIIDCTYKENFLKCPVYNPFKLPECSATRRYVEECIE
jgi:hypothetical protein